MHSSCHCQTSPPPGPAVAAQPPRTLLRSATAVGLGLLIAFFPKCPFCWAAWMSALGIAGLAQFPYFGLLYPVLLTMLGLHLLLLARHGRHTGYGPLIVSVCGACVILLTRASASEETWALRSGVVAMLAGSLWHSFSMKWRTHVPPSTPVIHKPIQQHL